MIFLTFSAVSCESTGPLSIDDIVSLPVEGKNEESPILSLRNTRNQGENLNVIQGMLRKCYFAILTFHKDFNKKIAFDILNYYF